MQGPLPQGFGLKLPTEKSPLFPSISALGRLLGHGLGWLGLATRAWDKGQRPWSSQARCRQAWKTDWIRGWGREWQPQTIPFLQK